MPAKTRVLAAPGNPTESGTLTVAEALAPAPMVPTTTGSGAALTEPTFTLVRMTLVASAPPRAVVLVCRDAESARRRFGTIDGRNGVCYTRTGRPCFTEPEKEAEFITRVQGALTRSGFFDEFHTDWFCLDCELTPWSAKARELLQRQYAPVGAARVSRPWRPSSKQ